jgi:hypothetical protein
MMKTFAVTIAFSMALSLQAFASGETVSERLSGNISQAEASKKIFQQIVFLIKDKGIAEIAPDFELTSIQQKANDPVHGQWTHEARFTNGFCIVETESKIIHGDDADFLTTTVTQADCS